MLGPKNHDDHESAFNGRRAWSYTGRKIASLSLAVKDCDA